MTRLMMGQLNPRDGMDVAEGQDETMEQDTTQAWQRVKERLQAELGRDLYTSWFGRMSLEIIADGVLKASVPTRFLKNWIETHYIDVFRRLCLEEFEDVKDVGILVRDVARPRPKTPTAVQDGVTAASLTPNAAAVGVHDENGSPLDPSLTFETFVSGESNALALAAARRVAEQPHGMPLRINPLYIHSPSGLGKTHLLNAIAWHILRNAPRRRILYISAERFMYRFLAALKNRDVLSFKDAFQSVDVLLIDDFQFLQGRTMQQEFCHTFSSLVDSRRQVVIAADVPPSQLDRLDERMRSRLNGGLVVDIDKPDHALRLAILHRKLDLARQRDTSLSIGDDVLEFIASRVTGGGRELEGALNRVIAAQQLMGAAQVTLDMAAHALKDLTRRNETHPVRIDDILRIVGRHYNVPKADLLSPRRARSIVFPRQIGMYLAKKLTSRSLPEIGRRFGGRDHSTVLHAVRKIEREISKDENLRREIDLLTRLIEQR